MAETLRTGFWRQSIRKGSSLNQLIGPSSGLKLEQAYGINHARQIVGEAMTASGEQHAFLLTPSSKPWAIVVIALAGLLARRRRTRA